MRLKVSWLAALGLALPCVTLGAAQRLPGEVELGSPIVLDSELRPRIAGRNAASIADRIASASLFSDEVLLELAPERLVAVSYVVDLEGATSVRSRFRPELVRLNGEAEQILAVRPDRVVLSDYSGSATLAQLESAGRPTLRVHAPHDFGELVAEVLRLGEFAQAQHRARDLEKAIERRLAALTPARARSPRRVLLFQGSYAYARGTLQHDCLQRLGLKNALDSLELRGTPTLTGEMLLAADPDLVIIADARQGWAEFPVARLPPAYPWQLLRAAKQGRIYAASQTAMGSISHHALCACELYREIVGRWP